jgi:hypothetical protein
MVSRGLDAGDEGTKAAVAGTGGLASKAIELELLIFLDESKAEVGAINLQIP